MSRICVVVPTYNEAENLPKLVEALEENLQNKDFTLIVVDDNSPDGTAHIAEKLNRRYGNIVVHRRPSKLGIGSAIRDGIEMALSFPSCKHIVTMDADLSHDPKDVVNLLREAKNADMVQGSRYIRGGKIIGWSLSRKVVSYVANFLCRLLLRTGFYEHTTYLRVYSRKCAYTVVKNVYCERYEWAIASILVAKSHGYITKETPITFVNRTQGKSKLKIYDAVSWSYFIIKTLLLRSSDKLGLI